VLLGLTLGGGAERILAFWGGGGLSPVTAGTGAILTVGAVMGLAELPFHAYRTFRVEGRFGFNRRGPGLFLRDILRETLVTLILLGPLTAGFLALMSDSGPYWWLAAWLLWGAFSLTLTWAYPKWIAPLFHRFTPLEDPRLRDRIAGLLKRCGFALRGVFVMDASRRTAHGNAYFTGLGPAKRVVFFDTLLDALRPEEVEAVLAHELGHYRLGHIRSGLAVSLAAALVGLVLLAWLRGQPWFFHALGLSRPTDAGALILVALAGPWLAFPLRPLSTAWSRRRERRADAFAVRFSDAGALVRALVALYRVNASPLTSDPVYARVYHSHPGPAERIAALEATAGKG
ncbi:MAG TPA: M48 family metallopeptidase, partial [Gammaproteobacteria bacterium]|nr:M48 family metallopeptidase [Gammaproteobacteria bacterium]